MKTRKKHETHDSFSQRPWFCTSLERLCGNDGNLPLIKAAGRHGEVVRTRVKTLEMVRHLAATLAGFGVAQKHVVVFDTPLCAETLILWMASLWLGASAEFLPADMKQRDKFAACEKARQNQDVPVVIVVKSPAQAKKYHELMPDSPVIFIDDGEGGESADKLLGWPLPDHIVRFGIAAESCKDAESLPQAMGCDDLCAAYVYSQGSHEAARRIAISHAHLRDQAENLVAAWNLQPDDCLFVHLASMHTVSLVLFATALLSGAAISFCDDDSCDIVGAYCKLDATFVCLLPADLAALRTAILEPQQESTRFQTLRNISLTLAKFRARNIRPYLKWSSPLIDRLFLVPIKNAYFPKVRAFVSFGNHFDSKVGELLGFLNMPVYNAYTLSEIGFVHLHSFMGNGSFLRSAETRIKSGILSVKPKRGGAPFINTKDFVFEDERCGLCVRSDSTVTLADGEPVDTAPMRDILCRYDIIQDVMIFGESRPFLTALLYLDEDALRRWAIEHKLAEKSFEQIAQNQQLYAHIHELVEACNRMRGTRESIQKFAILPKPIQQDPYILSPCLLTRPLEVERRYSAIIESFYNDNF